MKAANYVNRVPEEGDKEGEFKKIIADLEKNKELEEIYLRENELTDIQVTQLAEALSDHNQLKVLDLSYNNIQMNAVPPLKKIIHQHPQLKILRLEYNEIRDNGVQALVRDNPAELNQKIGKVNIDLSCNKITGTGLEAGKTLSLYSVLSILNGNLITDGSLIEQYREAALSRLDVKKVEDNGSSASTPTALASFTPLRGVVEGRGSPPAPTEKASGSEKAQII